MAVMLDDVALREAPFGKLTGATFLKGALVDVVSQSLPFLQLRARDKSVEGWAPAVAVDAHSDVLQPFDEEDRENYAVHCAVQAIRAGVYANYLFAIAQMRTSVTDGGHGELTGPFAISAEEWAVFGRPPYADPALQADDIRNAELQCEVFANQTRYYQDKLTEMLKGPPNAIDLCLAQMIGSDAFAGCLKAPDQPVQGVLAAADAAKAAQEGVDLSAAQARFATFLQGVTVDVARDRIDQALSKAFDDVKSLFPETEDTAPTQGADVVVSADVADGGVLGNLIGRFESGGKYGAFNRGVAGDAAGKLLPFETMSLGDIRNRQSLPMSDANRLFAVGKYQLIPGTLQSAIAALHLTLSQKYDPALQERLFRQYLAAIKRPPIKAYITGATLDGRTVTTFSALTSLCLEWASVADPATGKSHFGGSGGNKASISVATAQRALDQEKLAYAASLASKSPDDAWLALSLAAPAKPSVSRKIDFAFGDSLAVGQDGAIGGPGVTFVNHGFQALLNGQLIGDTGAAPKTILQHIATCLAANPNFFANKTVSLSSGLSNTDSSNRDEQFQFISQQIAKLKSAGATVVVSGVANNGVFHGEVGIGPELNAKLLDVAKAGGVAFAGGYTGQVKPDFIHCLPSGYKAMVTLARIASL